MSEYIRNIGCLMVLAAFVQMLAGEKFRKDIGFMLGLMMLAAVCAPISKTEFELPEIELPKTQTADNSSMREKILREGVQSGLEDEIKARTNAKRVKAVLNEDYSVKEIYIYGADNNAADTATELCGIEKGRVKVIE